jgi:hypothetical protein
MYLGRKEGTKKDAMPCHVHVPTVGCVGARHVIMPYLGT